MKRLGGLLISSVLVLSVLAPAPCATAAGIDDFKLLRAIPADTMIAVHSRDHAGRAFVQEQFKRVWAAIEAQHFDRDIKRLLGGLMQDEGTSAEDFNQQWQQMSDLAAGVNWSTLAKREFAFGMKLVAPMPPELVFLMMPPEGDVAKDFDGLAAIMKHLAGMAPPDALTHTTQGEGDAVIHKLAWAGGPPVSLTLARQKDVILVGFGSAMIEQSLALLRGESEPSGALPATERFKAALKQLPPPADGLFFVDVAKLMAQLRQFAGMLEQLVPSEPTTQPAEGAAEPKSPAAFAGPLVDQFDLWDYAAGVSTTDGMKTTSDEIVALKDDAKSRPLFKAVYGNPPLRDPLKYIPKEAGGVSLSNGLDFAALYKAITDFVTKEVPEGQQFLAMWEQQQQELKFNVEQDLLSWVGGGYATFSAARRSNYSPEWVFMLDVRDEAKARKLIDDLAARMAELPEGQGGTIDDAKIEGAEGFKLLVLPPMAAMLIGQPVIGVQDGRLFIGNGPNIVALALDVGAGKAENFSKSEKFQKEGLPLGDKTTSYQFKDLSKLGDELGQAFQMTGMLQMFMPPESMKDPAMMTLLSTLTKLGKVLKTLDFYKSSCEVATFDGKATLTRSVTNYQEPPKPAEPPASEKPGTEAGAKPQPDEK